MGVLDRSSDSNTKVAHYPNGGMPLKVTYRNGKVAEVGPGE
jgi:hypothetical protein